VVSRAGRPIRSSSAAIGPTEEIDHAMASIPASRGPFAVVLRDAGGSGGSSRRLFGSQLQIRRKRESGIVRLTRGAFVQVERCPDRDRWYSVRQWQRQTGVAVATLLGQSNAVCETSRWKANWKRPRFIRQATMRIGRERR